MLETISAQDIVDSVSEGLVVLDGDRLVVSANRAFLKLFEVDAEETIGQRLYDLGDGQWDIPALRLLIEDIVPKEANIESFEVDHQFPRVGRKIININARKVFRIGNHVEHLLMTFCDVTEIRQAELVARRAATVTRMIVDTIRDPLVILDDDLRITTASRNFVALFGDTEAEVIGKRIDELKQGQWDVTPLREALERVVPDERPFDDFLVEDDFPGLGKRAFKLNARKIHVPGNHVTQLLLAFEDVTDAIAADRYKDTMAAELAHRIKNSLAVISAFVAFEVRRAAAPCIDGYQAMQSRISAVADLYDVIAQSSAFGPVDIMAYLDGIARNIRSSLLGPDSAVRLVVDVEPFLISSDNAVPIGLLVNELATNAVKYAFPDGKGQVTLGFRRRDGEVTLFVEDNGIGIENSGERDGRSGMGTRFIDAFARQIGGTLARSSGTNGTSVTVRLPTSIVVGNLTIDTA